MRFCRALGSRHLPLQPQHVATDDDIILQPRAKLIPPPRVSSGELTSRVRPVLSPAVRVRPLLRLRSRGAVRPLNPPQAQVALPAGADDLLVGGAPQQRVGVLLPDVPLDGAELQRGQRAAAHHADHAVPPGVEVHQVLAAPVLVVVAPVVPSRDPAQARPRGPLDPGLADGGPGGRGQEERLVQALRDAPVAGAWRRGGRDHAGF
ncbi:hypothetical protein EYF80_032699 [Liparis tanakae]|uniref:Uncharacterized protein n=1 Tax=Liparis tanakae TaxID=230148 RepID=A0A4Z2GWZ7_9TELE|nr:hypothetical protein EYF80_032699 [Liparis tanakae]